MSDNAHIFIPYLSGLRLYKLAKRTKSNQLFVHRHIFKRLKTVTVVTYKIVSCAFYSRQLVELLLCSLDVLPDKIDHFILHLRKLSAIRKQSNSSLFNSFRCLFKLRLFLFHLTVSFSASSLYKCMFSNYCT